MKTYVGTADGHVLVLDPDGYQSESPLLSPTDVKKYADAFDWGANTPGAAQLALAILCDAMGNADDALRLHQRFKYRTTANPHVMRKGQPWRLTTGQIKAILREIVQVELDTAKTRRQVEAEPRSVASEGGPDIGFELK